MTYLRPHNRPQSRRNRLAFGALVAVAVVVALIQLLAPHVFPELFTAMARPFWRIELSLSSGAFRSSDQILAENEQLRQQIAGLELAQASSTISMLQSDNASLLRLLGRATSSPARYILGAVLARPSFVPYDELIIDAGADYGISSTSLVYAEGGVLVGRVFDVLPHTSRISLFSSPGGTYQVLIGPAHVPATAEGQGGGQYKAEVPHGSAVQPGDYVSDNALYDRAFGVVASIATDPSDPFDTVLFAPPVNIYQLRFVLVETGSAGPTRR